MFVPEGAQKEFSGYTCLLFIQIKNHFLKLFISELNIMNQNFKLLNLFPWKNNFESKMTNAHALILTPNQTLDKSNISINWSWRSSLVEVLTGSTIKVSKVKHTSAFKGHNTVLSSTPGISRFIYLLFYVRLYDETWVVAPSCYTHIKHIYQYLN